MILQKRITRVGRRSTSPCCLSCKMCSVLATSAVLCSLSPLFFFLNSHFYFSSICTSFLECFLRKMSFWGLVLVHAVPSGILARSAAPHSWTHSDTMLHDGMDRGYTEAADTTSFDISTIWEHEVQFLFIKTLKTKSSAERG